MSKLTEPIFAADTIGSYTFEEFMLSAGAAGRRGRKAELVRRDSRVRRQTKRGFVHNKVPLWSPAHGCPSPSKRTRGKVPVLQTLPRRGPYRKHDVQRIGTILRAAAPSRALQACLAE